jgi:hypothetical protein
VSPRTFETALVVWLRFKYCEYQFKCFLYVVNVSFSLFFFS